MSVNIALSWGVIKYMPSGFAGQTVELSVCDVNKNCVTGSATIQYNNALIASGQVNIQSAPFAIDSVEVKYGGNTIAFISGLNFIVDSTGPYTITISENYKLGLPLDFTITTDQGTAVWTYKSSLIHYFIRSGRVSTNIAVQYIAGDGNVIYTDSNPSFSLDLNTPTRVVAELRSVIQGSGQLCTIKLLANDVSATELSAKDTTQCLNISTSANFALREIIYVL